MSIRKDTIQLEVVINGTKAGQNAAEMRTKLRDLNREYEKLTPGTDAYNKKAAEIARATAQYNAHKNKVRELTAEIELAGKRVSPFTDILKKGAAAAVGFFAVERLIRYSREFVSFITNGTVALEDMRDKSARTFGDAIDIVQDFAAINAQSLGVTEAKYESLAAAIGSALVPMGFAREEAAKMSEQSLTAAGAIAEFSNGNLKLEQSTDLVRKGLNGQTKALREANIVITDAEVKARIAANGSKDLTGHLLAQAKAQAILQLITEKSRDAQAEFAASSDDAGRAQSRIAQYFAQQKENLLSGLLPAYKAVTNAVANFLSPLKRRSDLERDLQAQFNVQIETLKRGNISQENRVKLIDQINTKYKEYLPNLLSEKTSLEQLSAVQDQVNKKFEQRILQLATEEALREETAKSIKLKVEELELAQKFSEASIEKEKLHDRAIKSGRQEGKSINDVQAAYNDATVAVGKYSDALDKNKKKQDEQAEKVKAVTEAAKKLGLDINALLNTDIPVTPGDDPTPSQKSAAQIKFEELSALIEKERSLRLRLNDQVVQSDAEAALQREIINIDADNKIANARLKVFTDAAKEGERLTTAEQEKLNNEIIDRDTKRAETINKISLLQTTQLIEKERALKIDELNEDTVSAEKHARRLEIINRESDLAILEAKKQFAESTSEEYQKMLTEIHQKEIELADLVFNDQLQTRIDSLEAQRDLTLKGIDQLKLDEEDFQKYRARINLLYDKKILEERLKTFSKDSTEGVKLQNQIADIDRQLNAASSHFTIPDNALPQGGSSTNEDRDREQKAIEKAANAALGVAQNLASAQINLTRNRIENELNQELDAIDRIAEHKRQVAGKDAVLLKKIDAEQRIAREKAEKEAAIKRKAIARKEILIQGALAVVEALPDIAASIAAGVITLINLSTVDSQSFWYGGPTGDKGIYRDKSGKDVAGVVHTKEWVAPRHMVEDPETGPVISYLERVRQGRRGFAEGGFTSVSTIPSFPVQSVTSSSGSTELRQIRDLLHDIKSITSAWPRTLKAYVSLTDLEARQKEIGYIREQSVV